MPPKTQQKRQAKTVKLGSVVKKKPDAEGRSQGVVFKTNVDLIARNYDGSEVVIPRGSYVNIDNPRELPDKLLAMGKIDEERAEEMRAEIEEKVPSFVTFDLNYRIRNDEVTKGR